ncbi:paraneoplastic antigen Ma1 homolog [Alosa sapidissima]|uniref:paraneoplastic antigen Ma1 homolog n=1 Tax=Alosa sapidissima TaxID=34773 RepID=UPI001C0A1021|nr:paraneoplastic antigen Ma1 homolog [Alosa sapidissima]
MSGTQQAPGKRVVGRRPLSPGDEAAAKSTEAILRAVSDLLSKTSKSSSEHGSYRRLQTFSGLLPTPAGEEQFDHWLGQARLMVEECDCSRKEKRRRLMESLRGPAPDIVNAARASDPDVTPEDCLEALEHAFGTAESGEELFFAFRLLQQQSGEKLSDFLRRLEQSLNRVVQRDGLPLGCADKARLEQLLRGAIASDLMLVNLRLRERKAKPLTFLQLLKEIRTEEEFEASRKKITPVVQSGNVRQNADVKQTDIQNLKSEIKELKALVAAVVSKPVQDTSASSEKISPNVVYSECSLDSDVAALKKQMKRLQQKVTNKVGEPQAAVSAVNTSKSVASSPQQSFKVLEEHFCYRCGESGHFARKCQSTEKQAKVIKKLIQALKLSKNNQPSSDATNNAAVLLRKVLPTYLKMYVFLTGWLGRLV